MYNDFKITNYSKALVSPELYARHLSRLFTGDVIDGFTVTPGTGLQVVLAAGNTFIRYGTAAVASARLVSLVNNFNLTIATADVSNPRIDLVVVYVDNAVSLPGGTPTVSNLDGPGVAKAKIVQGTAAAVPAAPNSTAIQASVGGGNPYTVVAQVLVGAGVSVIAGDKITDTRSSAQVNATVPNAKLATGAGEPGGAWTSWTPTFTNLSGATVSIAKYKPIGRTVHFRMKLTFTGANITGAGVKFSLPVAAAADYGDTTYMYIGQCHLRDTNGTWYYAVAYIANETTSATIVLLNMSGSFAAQSNLSASSPFTWASGDTITIHGSYEAAP